MRDISFELETYINYHKFRTLKFRTFKFRTLNFGQNFAYFGRFRTNISDKICLKFLHFYSYFWWFFLSFLPNLRIPSENHFVIWTNFDKSTLFVPNGIDDKHVKGSIYRKVRSKNIFQMKNGCYKFRTPYISDTINFRRFKFRTKVCAKLKTSEIYGN